MASFVTFDSFLFKTVLLRVAEDDDIVVALYNVASVVLSACLLGINDNEPSLWLTAGVVCPASIHKHNRDKSSENTDKFNSSLFVISYIFIYFILYWGGAEPLPDSTPVEVIN